MNHDGKVDVADIATILTRMASQSIMTDEKGQASCQPDARKGNVRVVFHTECGPCATPGNEHITNADSLSEGLSAFILGAAYRRLSFSLRMTSRTYWSSPKMEPARRND